MECKLGAVPIPIVKPHVTVIYGSVPSVLDYRACQDSSFPFWIFHSWITETEIDTLDAYPGENL